MTNWVNIFKDCFVLCLVGIHQVRILVFDSYTKSFHSVVSLTKRKRKVIWIRALGFALFFTREVFIISRIWNFKRWKLRSSEVGGGVLKRAVIQILYHIIFLLENLTNFHLEREVRVGSIRQITCWHWVCQVGLSTVNLRWSVIRQAVYGWNMGSLGPGSPMARPAITTKQRATNQAGADELHDWRDV